MKTFVHSWQDLAEFLLEWEMFQTEVIEKSERNTHFMFNKSPPPPPPFPSFKKYEEKW